MCRRWCARQATHQMYILPRRSLHTASSMRRCAWPSTLSGGDGIDDTPITVPVSRPAPQAAADSTVHT